MSRILAYTTPARGHLFPVTPILDELHRRGHEIALRTLASQVPLMRERGFDAAPLEPAVEQIPINDYLARTPLGAEKRVVRAFCERAKVDAVDLHRAIDQLDPDALLVDINAWGAMIIAERWGGPWASWCPYPLPVPSRDTPPFGPGLRPALGLAGRIRDALLRPVFFGSLERIGTPRINEVREHLGLPPIKNAAEMFGKPPLLLSLTAEPFEYPRSDWPSNVCMVGPCDWDPPADPPPWLDEVDQPIVLVTTSSEFQDDGRLVRCALEALSGEDVYVVATLPAQDTTGITPPPNARVFSFLPHEPILQRATCAVTHAGMGATQKALAHGVPVCAVPFGRDQLEVARRLEVAQAGTRLPANRLRPDRLRRAVREAIGRVDGARRVAAAFAAAGGAKSAADAFEANLSQPRSRPRSAA
jgi:MGT family glycosyltransferase